jgi:hypothetical protein
MSQASSLFGVSGTPGNVIIDRDTGNYRLVSGAYPVDMDGLIGIAAGLE